MSDHSAAYLDLLGRRYSCRKFTDEQLTDEELAAILEAARLSPSARNNQPTRLCVVQDSAGLSKVDECSDCRFGAPTVIVVAYDHDVSSHPTAPNGPETCDFGDIDSSIALTNMDNVVGSLGLGACCVGRFDHDRVRELFGVPESYRLVCLLMVGHPDMGPAPRHFERRTLDELVSRESF